MPSWLHTLRVGALYATARIDHRHALALKALLLASFAAECRMVR